MNIKQLSYLNLIKTIWFNFRFLPFCEAIRLPVFISRKVSVRYCYRGFCVFEGGVKTGILRFGFADRKINPETYSSITIKGKLVLKGTGLRSFGPGTILGIGKEGVLTIGDNFSASVGNRIACGCSIIIGDDNMWSFDNVIMDTDSHQLYDENNEMFNFNKEIVFGNHVWLGCRTIVLKGSVIPDGCMVASGSTIAGVYTEQNSIITSKNKVIKSKIHWTKDKSINKTCKLNLGK